MLPYGVPRIVLADYPDVVDIRYGARKSSVGGRKRGYYKNKEAKSYMRRVWKKLARNAQKGVVRNWEAFE